MSCFNSCHELLSIQIGYATGSTLITKREILNKAGLFDISFKQHQDWGFLIRLFRFYQMEILPYVDVVICAGGTRNTPRTDVLSEVKRKLLQTFVIDIKILGTQEQADIYQAQWKEIIYNYLKEKKYSTTITFAQKNISKTSFKKGNMLNTILSCTVGIIPSLMIVVYSVYDPKLNRFRKDII